MKSNPKTEACQIKLGKDNNTISVEFDGQWWHIAVPPPSRISVRNEVRPSRDNARWPIMPLRNRPVSGSVWPVPGAVQIETLRVWRLDRNGGRTALARGIDFDLDTHFCGIVPLAQSRDEEEYCLDYDLFLQRVDALAVKDGALRVFFGAEALTSPRWALPPSGWTTLARIYWRFRDTLDESALFPLADAQDGSLVNYPVLSDSAARMPDGGKPESLSSNEVRLWTESMPYADFIGGSPRALSRLRLAFQSKPAYRIVFFGDSITQGGDVHADWRWTERFARFLTARAADKSLDFVNAAVGGTSSSFGRERFERDVLARQPDAVTILFALNDKKLDDATFTANHLFFVNELRARRIEPILLTSNMNTSVWMGGLDHAQQRIRDFCMEHDLICLDVYGLWKRLADYGIPYETLLANGINHPDNVAAGVPYELLKRAFCETG